MHTHTPNLRCDRLGEIEERGGAFVLWMVTEPVQPLWQALNTANLGALEREAYIAMGLNAVCQALATMHRHGIVHGAIRADAIYVTPELDWKVGGFEFATEVSLLDSTITSRGGSGSGSGSGSGRGSGSGSGSGYDGYGYAGAHGSAGVPPLRRVKEFCPVYYLCPELARGEMEVGSGAGKMPTHGFDAWGLGYVLVRRGMGMGMGVGEGEIGSGLI